MENGRTVPGNPMIFTSASSGSCCLAVSYQNQRSTCFADVINGIKPVLHRRLHRSPPSQGVGAHFIPYTFDACLIKGSQDIIDIFDVCALFNEFGCYYILSLTIYSAVTTTNYSNQWIGLKTLRYLPALHIYATSLSLISMAMAGLILSVISFSCASVKRGIGARGYPP